MNQIKITGGPTPVTTRIYVNDIELECFSVRFDAGVGQDQNTLTVVLPVDDLWIEGDARVLIERLEHEDDTEGEGG